MKLAFFFLKVLATLIEERRAKKEEGRGRKERERKERKGRGDIQYTERKERKGAGRSVDERKMR